MPLSDFVAAASAGIVGGEALLDLCYEEDAAAEVDMNIVMTGGGRFVEIQATGEESTFTEDQHAALIRLAREGIRTLTGLQRGALGGIAERIGAGR
jgi:ribonuclease PH